MLNGSRRRVTRRALGLGALSAVAVLVLARPMGRATVADAATPAPTSTPAAVLRRTIPAPGPSVEIGTGAAGAVLAAAAVATTAPTSTQAPPITTPTTRAPDATPAPAPTAPTGPSQAIVVETGGVMNSSTATVHAFSWNGTGWDEVLHAMTARLGPRGWTDTPHEADGYTPTGDYAIEYGFGHIANPGTALEWKQAGPDDHWVDDTDSPFYNTWQTGDPDGRWASAENLSAYRLAVVFDFNEHPAQPDHNSAIFLHAGGMDTASGGCIVLSSRDMMALLEWLDPAAHPRIVMGPDAEPPSR